MGEKYPILWKTCCCRTDFLSLFRMKTFCLYLEWKYFFFNYTFRNGALNKELYHVGALEPLNLRALGSPALSLSIGSRQLQLLGTWVRCLGCLEGSAPQKNQSQQHLSSWRRGEWVYRNSRAITEQNTPCRTSHCCWSGKSDEKMSLSEGL